jgi:hypothetical protein
MILRASIVLGLAMVVNHLWHGWACWGFRPGGFISMWIYAAQLAVAGIGSVVAIRRVMREDLPDATRAAMRIAMYAVVAGLVFFLGGGVAFTSAHYQFPYTTIAFFAAWVSGMVAGVAVERLKSVGDSVCEVRRSKTESKG